MEQYISKSAKIGKNFKSGYGTIIHNNVVIGDNVNVGNNVVIHPSTQIGDNTVIQDFSILGKSPQLSPTSTLKTKRTLLPLFIGRNCNIGTSVIIFEGASLTNNITVGDTAFIREECHIGDFVLIGKGVILENGTVVGPYTKIQTNAYITAGTTIEDKVFIAPLVITTNDNFMGRTERRFALKKGPLIKKGARVGAGAIILPGLTIGREVFIAAGSVVTKNVPDFKLVMGVPARVIRDVPKEELLKNQ